VVKGGKQVVKFSMGGKTGGKRVVKYSLGGITRVVKLYSPLPQSNQNLSYILLSQNNISYFSFIRVSLFVTMSASSVTRTGKPIDCPNESDLYSRNPCPPLSYFTGIAWLFFDASERHYWPVQAYDKLQDWLASCQSLQQAIEHVFDHVLFFGRQDKQILNQRSNTPTATALSALIRCPLIQQPSTARIDERTGEQ
jgi:hypothetical protein